MTTLEILRAARALIAQPGRWCQGSYASQIHSWEAADRNDLSRYLSDESCQFCAVGSCYAVGGLAAKHAERALDSTARSMKVPRCSIAEEINDTTDLPTVLAMFDATIARLEGQGEAR